MAMVKQNILALHFGKTPMAKPLLAFLPGICVGYYTTASQYSFWDELLLILTVLQLVGFVNRKKFWGRLLFPLNFYLLWTVLGIWTTVHTMPSYQATHFSTFESESLFIVVKDEPHLKGGYIRFPADVKAAVQKGKLHRSTGKLMVTLQLDTAKRKKLRYGDLLQIENLIQTIKPPANPKEFDYKTHLRSKDIQQQCFLSADQIVKVDSQQGNPIVERALLFREQMLHKFATNIKDSNSMQLAMALIFGYRSQIDIDTINVFRNTGTVHILSVSGLHVGLVFALLTLLLKWMNRLFWGRYLRSIVVLTAVWFYVILTGMSPPILRAGIMITFFIVSTGVNRIQVPLNTLFASALFILIFSPKSLFDVGFQLSYFAVLGILILYPLFKSFYHPKRRVVAGIVDYLYISVAAQLFTLPLILYYFGQFPTYFIPANLFIAIPSTAIMYLGILLALSPFSIVSDYAGQALDGLLYVAVEGLGYIERLPGAVLQGIIWNEIQVVLFFFVLFATLWAWNFREKKAVFFSLYCLVSFFVYTNVLYVKRRSFSSYRVYNVRSEVAIAYIEKGKVVLYSTFDSLRHKSNVYSVLPDLKQFADEHAITFVKLPEADRANYTLSLGKRKILVLERELRDTVVDVDIVLWRKNNRSTLEYMINRNIQTPMILVDGSNSDKTLATIQLRNDIVREQLYILKNNFAYVWDEE
ncbi:MULTISPECIES: ComEC/Rec2 family competence protein [Sphingobacterium]|uniref:ComEC/Rec2 family competence protein n=1 Tax=Sphingobacterium TaxID=28453 RepID=UPI0013DD3C3D|nr:MULTISPECIES: ComEC/Rec2 family competence protein [unclassified Sphingobacterium]